MNEYIRKLYEEKREIEYKIEGLQRSLAFSSSDKIRKAYFDILTDLRQQVVNLQNRIEFARSLEVANYEDSIHKTR